MNYQRKMFRKKITTPLKFTELLEVFAKDRTIISTLEYLLVKQKSINFNRTSCLEVSFKITVKMKNNYFLFPLNQQFGKSGNKRKIST